MITESLSALWWRWVSSRGSIIIGVTVASALLALAIFLKWGSLNSDLGQLIRPSDELKWYQANEAFKRDFPQLQQTAIVVLRGLDAAEVSRATQSMRDRLNAEADFASVFAPTVDPYIKEHRLHFLSKDQLAAWQRGADYTYGAVLRLADETSLENFAFTLTDFVSANPGQPLPIALDTFLDVVAGTPDASFSTFYPLVDPNQAEYLEFIVVQGTQNLDQPLPNAQIVAQLEAISALITRAFNVDVAITGEVALANEEIGAALTGIEIAGALSVVIIALILGVGLRSLRVIGIIFAKLLLGSCLTLGAATILVGSFNTLSMLFVVMFFGLGIDFSLHFILRAMADGFVDEQGLKSTFKDTAPALGLCTLTSAIAFLAFVPTDYLGLGELGLISAAGMLIALLLTLLFVPAAYLKWHDHYASKRTSFSVQRRLRLTPLGVRLLGCLFLVGSPLALAIALDTQFNYNVLSMRNPDSPAMRALVDLQASGYETDYSIQLTASNEQAASALKARLEKLPSVKAVNLPLDFAPAHDIDKDRILEELAQKYAEIEPLSPEVSNERTLAESYSMISEYIDFARTRLTETEAESLDRLANALPKYFKDPSLKAETEQAWHATFIRSQVALNQMLTAPAPTLASLPDRFRSRFITAAGEHLVTVQPSHSLTSRDQTDQFVADVRSIDPMAAGRTMVEWGIGEVVIEAFFQAILTTLIAVIVLLILYFKRLTPVVLVLLPIGLTILYTLAIAEWLGLSLNMANILVVPLIIGLGVDTGIHIIHRYDQSGPSYAVAATHKAVVLSGLTTCGTFFSLSFSPHGGAASIGLLLTIAIGSLLAISLTVLPLLSRRFGLSHTRGAKFT